MSAEPCLSYLQCINWNSGCFLSEERHIYLWWIVTKLPKTRKLLTTNVSLFNLHCLPCFCYFYCYWTRVFLLSEVLFMCVSFMTVPHQYYHSPILSPSFSENGKSQPLALLKWLSWVFSITIHSKSHNTFLCSDTYQNKYQKSYTLYSLFLSKHFPH